MAVRALWSEGQSVYRKHRNSHFISLNPKTQWRLPLGFWVCTAISANLRAQRADDAVGAQQQVERVERVSHDDVALQQRRGAAAFAADDSDR
ncbi:MAG: hypothetical protein K0R75_3095 [Paenibacillaceae bacterium]|nr:hypothetical protein [Paenibacillaceae bacterium]